MNNSLSIVFSRFFSSVYQAVFILWLTVSCAVAGENDFLYQERVGDEITKFTWSAKAKGDLIEVVSEAEKKIFHNLCRSDGVTLEWKMKDEFEGHDIKALRQQDLLKISGVKNGERYEETVGLGGKPWFQPISFSLRDFLKSSGNSISFWTIRADKVEPIVLEAVKKGEEKLRYNNELVLAQKVEVRAEGFFSHFWHGTYWYRKSDKQLLLYKSVHGLPGTKETIVQLVAEPR